MSHPFGAEFQKIFYGAFRIVEPKHRGEPQYETKYIPGRGSIIQIFTRRKPNTYRVHHAWVSGYMEISPEDRPHDRFKISASLFGGESRYLSDEQMRASGHPKHRSVNRRECCTTQHTEPHVIDCVEGGW